MKEEKFYLIAKGGYLKESYIEEITIRETDMEQEEDEFEDFEDYKNYILEESAAEFEQKFAQVMVMTEEEYKNLKN